MVHYTYGQVGLLTKNLGIRPRLANRWAVSTMVWGAAAGVYGLYVLSYTPLVKREFLSKLPLIGSYYTDNRPPSDKPM